MVVEASSSLYRVAVDGHVLLCSLRGALTAEDTGYTNLVAVGDRVYVTPSLDGPVVALDAATGQTVREYAGTESTEEILVADDTLYLVVGTSEQNRRGGGLFARGEPAATDFRFITAIEADTGTALWKKAFDQGESLLPLTLAVKGSRVCYQTSSGIACLDARSGEQLWKTARATPARRMAFSAPTLVATDDVILLADTDMNGAEKVAARLVRQNGEANLDTERGSITPTISLGISSATGEMPTLESLVERADNALCAAKQAGRHCYRMERPHHNGVDYVGPGCT